MGRIAAIDFGLKRIGIAISDERQKIAFPLETVPNVAEIQKVLKKYSITLILVGLPLLLSGKEGDMAAAVKKFAKDLEETTKIPVKLIDERFSSKIAEQSLREIHLNRKERSAKMDATTAAMLLQSYLDGL